MRGGAHRTDTDLGQATMNDPIYERLALLLQRRYHLDPAVLSPGSTLAELGLDSMFIEELLLIMPDVFGVDTTDTPRRDLTLDQVSDWLREHGGHG